MIGIDMEVFLLIIVIGLIIIFYFQLKDKLQHIENRLFEISNKKITQNSDNKTIAPNPETIIEIPKVEIIEPNPIVNPVEEIIAPIDEKQLAFEQELNAVIAEINENKVEQTEEYETEQEPINLFESVNSEPVNNEPILEKTWYEKIDKNNDLEKFIGENLISKIGIAILVLRKQQV
jgi:hypothetical protein